MPHSNSFDFVRFFAASVVLIAHHFLITGGAIPSAFGEDAAGYALDVFFCLSGFLIFQSLERSNDWASFTAARLTRLVPTFVAAPVLVSAATLVWFHNYEHTLAHVKYVYRNFFLMLRINSDFIPGVFDANHHAEVNTPLWSLAYELWLYCALFTIALLPRQRWVLGICVYALVLNTFWLTFGVNEGLIPLTPIFAMRIGRLGCFFFAGSLIAAFWETLEARSVLWGALAAAAFIAICFVFPPKTFLHAGLLAMAVIGLGSGSALSWFSKGGDPSYGMYLFAWPIQQFSAMLFSNFYVSLFVALLATITAGYFTYHLYEKTCIRQRKTIAEILRRSIDRRAYREA